MVFAAFFVGAAQAEETVLLRRGGLSLSGEILGFDGTYLRLRTETGEVTLDYRAATCEGALCPDMANYVPALRLSGPGRLSDVLLPALIEGYARAQGLRAIRRNIGDLDFEYDIEDPSAGQPVLRFSFRVSSSAEGFADLLADQADIALSEREVREAESVRAYEAGQGNLSEARRSEIVALDALVPVVSARRQAVAISVEQLSALFAGELSDWSALGQTPGPVHLHLLALEDGQTQDFIDRVLAPKSRSLAATVTHHPSRDALLDAVGTDPNALGVASFGEYGFAQPLPLGGSCGMEQQATLRSLKTEDYPLTRPLFLYFPQRRLPPEAHDWLAWMRTAEAHRVVRRAGFVDKAPLPIPIRDQGDRLARAIAITGQDISVEALQSMMAQLSGQERLSLSFRFTPGSTRLDAQSRSNLMQLGRALRDGVYDGRRLSLIGFSDGKGAAEANQRLSRARAESVLRALTKALGGALPENVTLTLDAFGEALPLACDDSDLGRQSNRRVELWITPL